MVDYWWIALAVFIPLAGLAAVYAARRLRTALIEQKLAAARRDFRRQREWLEARFLTVASQSGKPRGLAWANCEFADEVAFARERRTGELRALVAVSISFTAVEGGGMEENPNVGNLRAATAVFLHRLGHWETDGRAIMNLSPHQAIDHFRQELEVVE